MGYNHFLDSLNDAEEMMIVDVIHNPVVVNRMEMEMAMVGMSLVGMADFLL
jgi:hypothetical protein